LGAVKKKFISGILEREKMGVTYIGSGIVFPHTYEKYINYSQVAFVRLKKPIKWGGYEVDIICLLALKNLVVENFKIIHQNLMQNLKIIKNSNNTNEIKEGLISAGRENN